MAKTREELIEKLRIRYYNTKDHLRDSDDIRKEIGDIVKKHLEPQDTAVVEKQAVSGITKIDIARQERESYCSSVEIRKGMTYLDWLKMRSEYERHHQGMINLNIEGLDNLP